ncbi:hypothetical protein FACS1894105_09030 [Clostridia bacterium]|nr:hypothetical protein FACS1894105_09030 [Clostridia bacterium]GHV12371.1 hypothetical protein FACS1894219_05120 [Clostridia bacterium]
MGNVVTVNTVIQGLFLGVAIAILAIGYNKIVLGRLVKALIKSEATHPATAKTIADLHVRHTIFLRFALRKNGTLRKFIREADIAGKDGKTAFYIPEDKLYRAGRLYGGRDVDPLMIVVSLVIVAIFFVAVQLFLPVILNQVQQII